MTLEPACLGLATMITLGGGAQGQTAPPTGQTAFATAAVTACLTFAAQNKLPPLSIAVVDSSGTLLAFSRADGASPATADAALLKARSALRMGVPTAVLPALAERDPTLTPTLQLLGMTTMPGGVPVARADGGISGAIGVSGSRNEDDARCAAAAAAARP